MNTEISRTTVADDGEVASRLKVSISPRVFEMIPTYKRVVLTCSLSTAEPPENNTTVEHAFREASHRFETSYRDRDLLDVGAFSAWRDAFRHAGINPSKFRPAAEALARRAAKGLAPRTGLALVDLGTAVTLETMCPIGIHVVDDLTDPLWLGPAAGTELFSDFSGETSTPEAGEIIYASGQEVLTRRWAWRQGRLGSIRPGVRRLAINVDLLGDISAGPATKMLTALLSSCGGTEFRITELTPVTPAAILAWFS